MINKIKSIFKKQSIGAIFASGVATLIKTITGFVTNKVIAIYIGPAGIVLVGQLMNLISILLPVSTGGINNGVTKYIAEYNTENPDKAQKIINASFRITLLVSLFLGLLVIIFSHALSVYIFHADIYQDVMIIFGVSLLFYSFNSIFLSVINGFKEFKLYNFINILTSVVGFAFTVTLSVLFRVKGTLIAAVSFQSVTFFITVYLIRKKAWFSIKHMLEKIDYEQVKKLLGFSLMAIVSSFTLPVSQIFIRNYIIDHETLVGAGYWESVNRISNMYLSLITTALSTYYLPRLSELVNRPQELKQEVYNSFKLFMPMLFVITLSIYLCRDLIIIVVFTRSFAPMRELFLFQLIGDIFKIGSWLLGLVIWAYARVKRFIFIEVFYAVSYYVLSVFFVSKFSLVGATYAFAFNYMICFVLMFISFRTLTSKAK